MILKNIRFVVLSLILCFLLTFCGRPEVISDLSDTSFPLVNQDGTSVSFPGDFKGDILVTGFIYTHCPDICSAITANLKNVSQQLKSREDVHFIGITFDPGRDTPAVLKQYMEQFKLDEDQFTFLTGDSTTVDSLLAAMDIRAEISHRKTTDDGQQLYFINHTNRISLLDEQGRIRLEYSGSYDKPPYIIEGINKLR